MKLQTKQSCFAGNLQCPAILLVQNKSRNQIVEHHMAESIVKFFSHPPSPNSMDRREWARSKFKSRVEDQTDIAALCTHISRGGSKHQT